MVVKNEILPVANNGVPAAEQANGGSIDPELQTEINQLTFRLHALDNFAIECRAEGGRVRAKNRIDYLDEHPELEDQTDQISVETKKMEQAKTTASAMRVLAKANFSNSLGIKANAVIEKDEDDKIIDAKFILDDTSKECELRDKYRRFRMSFAQSGNSRKRDRRRQELRHEITAR